MSIRTKRPWPAAMPDEDADALGAELGIDAQPEPGQLHAHVRVEPLGLDRRHRPLVLGSDRQRLVRGGNLLAEDVERRLLPGLVQRPHGGDGVGQVGPRDVALREPPHDSPRDGGKHPDDRAVEEGQGVSEDDVLVAGVRWSFRNQDAGSARSRRLRALRTRLGAARPAAQAAFRQALLILARRPLPARTMASWRTSSTARPPRLPPSPSPGRGPPPGTSSSGRSSRALRRGRRRRRHPLLRVEPGRPRHRRRRRDHAAARSSCAASRTTRSRPRRSASSSAASRPSSSGRSSTSPSRRRATILRGPRVREGKL